MFLGVGWIWYRPLVGGALVAISIVAMVTKMVISSQSKCYWILHTQTTVLGSYLNYRKGVHTKFWPNSDLFPKKM